MRVDTSINSTMISRNRKGRSPEARTGTPTQNQIDIKDIKMIGRKEEDIVVVVIVAIAVGTGRSILRKGVVRGRRDPASGMLDLANLINELNSS